VSVRLPESTVTHSGSPHCLAAESEPNTWRAEGAACHCSSREEGTKNQSRNNDGNSKEEQERKNEVKKVTKKMRKEGSAELSKKDGK
jgi:hypothetical protein